MLSVLFNKREKKPFVIDIHSDTDRYKYKNKFTRQFSGRHRLRPIQQTDRNNGRHRKDDKMSRSWSNDIKKIYFIF